MLKSPSCRPYGHFVLNRRNPIAQQDIGRDAYVRELSCWPEQFIVRVICCSHQNFLAGGVSTHVPIPQQFPLSKKMLDRFAYCIYCAYTDVHHFPNR